MRVEDDPFQDTWSPSHVPVKEGRRRHLPTGRRRRGGRGAGQFWSAEPSEESDTADKTTSGRRSIEPKKGPLTTVEGQKTETAICQNNRTSLPAEAGEATKGNKGTEKRKKKTSQRAEAGKGNREDAKTSQRAEAGETKTGSRRQSGGQMPVKSGWREPRAYPQEGGKEEAKKKKERVAGEQKPTQTRGTPPRNATTERNERKKATTRRGEGTKRKKGKRKKKRRAEEANTHTRTKTKRKKREKKKRKTEQATRDNNTQSRTKERTSFVEQAGQG